MIRYTIKPACQHLHKFAVSITCSALPKQQLSLPNWILGSYLIRDFCKHILSLSVVNLETREDLNVTQVTKNSYEIKNENTVAIEINYEVYAWDFSVRGAHLDQTHGFFNGTCVFFKLVGLEHDPCQLNIIAPKEWRVATGMRRLTGDKFESGLFEAKSYEDLVDYPCEMGDLEIQEFVANDIMHYLVINGRHFGDLARITEDLAKICNYEFKMFGNDKIFDSYWFLVTVVDSGYGGLEHNNSTALICNRQSLISKHETAVTNDYFNFLGLCAHEYLHNWNVKRIRPQEFIGCDLEREVYTKQLWAYEGITSYLDDLIVYKSGLVDSAFYLKAVSNNLSQVLSGSGRLIQDLYSSSFNAWTKFYQQDENAGNAIVSYYKKGAVFALFLDLQMRLRTNFKKSIFDLLILLWTEYGKKNIGTAFDTHQKLVEEVCGCSFTDVFEYLSSCADIPLDASLQEVGVRLNFKPKTVLNASAFAASSDKPWLDLGIQGRFENNGFYVQAVAKDSLAAAAGVSAGDYLISINKFKIVVGTFNYLLNNLQQEPEILLHWFRRDQLFEAVVSNNKAGSKLAELQVVDASKLDKWLVD